MAIKVNTTLETVEGFSVPSGAIVRYSIRTRADKPKTITYALELYKSQADMEAGERALSGVKEFDSIISVDFTKVELVSLTYPQFETALLDKIEEAVGAGNCSQVDLIPND